MKIYVAKKYSEVEAHIDLVQSYADNNKDALGFLPSSVYKELAYKNQLWLAVSPETNSPLGHLLFGGRFPNLRVKQIVTYPGNECMGVAKKLIKELVVFGEKNNYLSILARVAADLEANIFWKKMEFGIVKQEKGGKVRDRNINIRVRELDSMSLFKGLYPSAKNDSKEKTVLRYKEKPLSINSTYAIDLNVFFDVAKQRNEFSEANNVIRAAFNNKLKLCVTKEFVKELERTSTSQNEDILLNFARELPTLPDIAGATVVEVLAELRELIFPHRSKDGRKAPNDASDLMHLVTCIHHGLHGFITREKAILNKSLEIKQEYNVEVISPADIVESKDLIALSKINVDCGGNNIQITEFEESQRITIEDFISLNGEDDVVVDDILTPSTTGNKRRRIVAMYGDSIAGIATWNLTDKHNPIIRAYIVTDEYFSEIKKVIDHFIETLSRDVKAVTLTRIDLNIGSVNEESINIAISRGFRKIHNNESRVLSKITYSGPIFQSDWPLFSQAYKKLAGLGLPERMPTHDEFINTGVIIEGVSKEEKLNINLFDFETLHSPACFLSKQRGGVLMPIRKEYAYELFNEIRIQEEMFSSKEALLCVEKAYFRKPSSVKSFEKGMLVVFYVSGKDNGPQEAVGCARITFSDTMPPEDATLNLARQGVLSMGEMKKMVDSGNNLHAITFDNFCLFPTKIPYNILKSMGCVGRTNLVTSEFISEEKMHKIFRAAYEGYLV